MLPAKSVLWFGCGDNKTKIWIVWMRIDEIAAQILRFLFYVCVIIISDLVFSYVVDAADHDNISISRSELHDLLSKPSLNGIPLLVLGNKIDKAGALSKEALTDQM